MTEIKESVPKSLYDGERHRADRCEAALRAALARAEQAEVQLAGCGVAALGGIGDRFPVAKKGDYGWSQSYEDVVLLRTRFEELVRRSNA
jgi:hypothetical protein